MKKKMLIALLFTIGALSVVSGCGKEPAPIDPVNSGSVATTAATTATTEDTTAASVGMSDAEVKKAVEDEITAMFAECDIKLTAGDQFVVISAKDAGLGIGEVELKNRLAEKGYDEDVLPRYLALNTLPQEKLNSDYLRKQIKELGDKLGANKSEFEYNDVCVTVKVAPDSLFLKENTTLALVKNAIQNKEFGDLEADCESGKAVLDWDALLAAATVEASDAHYEFVDQVKNAVLVPEVKGKTIDVEAAKALYESTEPGKSIQIPITAKEPAITAANIDQSSFYYEISSFTTYYNANQTGRTQNVRKAAENINGAVIMPGEKFSFNNTVGERTEANGFTYATIYVNGGMDDGLGGGICQVSSTIYGATLRSNFAQTTRYNHAFTVSYAKDGEDATVSWGWLDYCFRNEFDFPVRIVMEMSGGALTCKIMGKEPADKYSVTIEHEELEVLEKEVVIEQDDSLQPGEEQVIRRGFNGVKVKTTVTLYKNNEIVSTRSYTDVYSPYNGLTKVGPAIETTDATVAPETTAVPPETTAASTDATEPPAAS